MRRRPVLWGCYLAVLTVHTIAIVGQPLFAGAFLNGHYDALGLHAAGSTVAVATGLLCVLVGLLQWRPGRGRVGWLLVSLLLLATEILQTVAGYSRWLGVHVPLGVAVVGGVVALWVTAVRSTVRHRPGRPAAELQDVRS